MRSGRLFVAILPVIVAACASNPDKHTLARLESVKPDVKEVSVDDSLDKAMRSYRQFLAHTPNAAMAPEAMRRLADLKIEKEYGIEGGVPTAKAAPDSGSAPAARPASAAPPASHARASAAAKPTLAGEARKHATTLSAPRATSIPATAATRKKSAAQPKAATTADFSESDEAFERRTTQQKKLAAGGDSHDLSLPGGPDDLARAGPLQAIKIYKQLLTRYPTYEHNDQVLYQMARAYDELGRTEQAMKVMKRLITQYPASHYVDEIQFRRGEYFFTRKKYRDAENAYSAVIALGKGSEYYELALYKLGWSLYKQEFYEEALNKFLALLDYKLSIGYDFDHPDGKEDERRVADTFRVISLSFSNLGGPEYLPKYFAKNGRRSYEDRIYSNLGEFYLSKLRYNDAAAAYKLFVKLNPFDRVSPRFSMRVAEIYSKGGFPELVVQAKKDFASRYGLQSKYWNHFDVHKSPKVLGYLKTNLKDLADYYHSRYQDKNLEKEKSANYREASHWYRVFLSSFPKDAESPTINYQLAELLLEHKDYGEAAKEYERTAYDYPRNDKSSAAGYAAVYAYREELKTAPPQERRQVKRAAVASSLKFADSFPKHKKAPAVLGAAVDDLYEMKDYQQAIASGQKLIQRYPHTDIALRRSAWEVVGHSSFELAAYKNAEKAFARVIEITPQKDKSRQGLIDNLAASIYKQGEQANKAADYRAAADNFLRVGAVAPTSKIRPAADYDGAAALIRLKDWPKAAKVLEQFRSAYPKNKLQPKVTKQLAFVYRQEGQLSRSAGEYERVAAQSKDPELRSQAMLLAGDLYRKSKDTDKALKAYLKYVDQFPEPLDLAQETRFKIAKLYKAKGDQERYHKELAQIVSVDKAAGPKRTDRSRYLAAQSALVLAEKLYDRFAAIKLVQPFKQSLAEKQQSMDAAMKAFQSLVDYEVADVTAAATFYMGRVYYGFSQALKQSERPSGLSPSQMKQYDAAIAQQAHPFEIQAIDLYKQNLQLMAKNVYDPWIQKSLDALAHLLPGRYARPEVSSGFITSIDRYAYVLPGAKSKDQKEAAQSGKKQIDPQASRTAVTAGVFNGQGR